MQNVSNGRCHEESHRLTMAEAGEEDVRASSMVELAAVHSAQSAGQCIKCSVRRSVQRFDFPIIPPICLVQSAGGERRERERQNGCERRKLEKRMKWKLEGNIKKDREGEKDKGKERDRIKLK